MFFSVFLMFDGHVAVRVAGPGGDRLVLHRILALCLSAWVGFAGAVLAAAAEGAASGLLVALGVDCSTSPDAPASPSGLVVKDWSRLWACAVSSVD